MLTLYDHVIAKGRAGVVSKIDAESCEVTFFDMTTERLGLGNVEKFVMPESQRQARAVVFDHLKNGADIVDCFIKLLNIEAEATRAYTI